MLSETEARTLTKEAYQVGEEFFSLLERLYKGKAHKALGYRTFAAYFNTEFRGMSVPAIPKEDRPAVVRKLTDAGMSTREVGAATKLGRTTVRRTLSGPNGPVRVIKTDPVDDPYCTVPRAALTKEVEGWMTTTEKLANRLNAGELAIFIDALEQLLAQAKEAR